MSDCHSTVENSAATRLAASARPIADVLVDALRRRSKSVTIAPEADDDRFALVVGDEAANVPARVGAQVLRPEEIAAAILLGRGLDQFRSALATLQGTDRVTIFEVANAELVEPIARLLRNEVIGGECVIGTAELESGIDAVAEPGTVAVFGDSDEGKRRKTGDGEQAIRAAVQRRCAIVAVSSDPERLLPPALLRLADERIRVPCLDAAAVAATIAAVTGRSIEGSIALSARPRLADLNLAIRDDLGPERSLARLKRVLGGPRERDSTPLLSQMHGLGEARSWGLALVADLRAYAAGAIAWSDVDKGALLTGPPGTGKTSFARALAREALVHFVATSYSEWQSHREGHLGHVTMAIRSAFAEASRNAPAILFIDEIDAIPARGKAKWNDDWWRSITTCLLECLDGYQRREGVIVIAACNSDASGLDPALVRAGRLDRHIAIALPDLPDLIGILRMHLGPDLADADLRPAALAARGHSGAEVEKFVREARNKARREKRAFGSRDLLEAIRNGRPELPPDVKWRVAHHEAGHAIANFAFGLAETVSLSIGSAGGATKSEPGEMRAQTRSHLERYLAFLLAGRAAEELVYGEATAGAGGSEKSDLARATWLAARLESSYGLGRSGLLWHANDGATHLNLHPYLVTAVQTTLAAVYRQTKQLLSANRRSLDALATALFEAGHLERAEIAEILARIPVNTDHSHFARSVMQYAGSPRPTANPAPTDRSASEMADTLPETGAIKRQVDRSHS